MTDIDNLIHDLRSRVNPAYADHIGTENLMALADAYADACFKQGLNAQPEDPQPEIARSLLLDGIERLQDELDEIAMLEERAAGLSASNHVLSNEIERLQAELDALRRNNSYCPMCGSGTVPSVPEKRHYATGEGLVETMLGQFAKLQSSTGTGRSAVTTNPALAAIKYAIEHECDEPVEFLRAWYEGDFDVIRREWDDVPEDVFIGADPLHSMAAPKPGEPT